MYNTKRSGLRFALKNASGDIYWSGRRPITFDLHTCDVIEGFEYADKFRTET